MTRVGRGDERGVMVSTPPHGGTPRWRVNGLLTVLSMSRFIALGFFTNDMVTILRARGVALDRLGVVQLALVIPAIRFLWAPLLDRYGWRPAPYRTWLLILIPALTLTAVAAATLDPIRQLGTVLALVMVAVTLCTTQNIAADAITVRLLDDTGRGVANGLQVAGGYAGALLSGGLLLLIYDHLGWNATLLLLAAITLLPSGTLVGFREPARTASTSTAGQLAWGFASLAGVLRQPGAARWALVVLPLYWAGVFSASVLIAPMLVDSHWSLSRIAIAANTTSQVVALCAGLAAGVLLTRLGRRRALLIGGASQVLAACALLPLAFGSSPTVPTVLAVCLVQSAYAISATVVVTVSMSFCRSECAGTDAGLLAAVGSAMAAACSAAALPAAGLFGYPTVIIACALIALAATVVVHLVVPTSPDTANPVEHSEAQ